MSVATPPALPPPYPHPTPTYPIRLSPPTSNPTWLPPVHCKGCCKLCHQWIHPIHPSLVYPRVQPPPPPPPPPPSPIYLAHPSLHSPIGLPILTSVASDLLNDALWLENELSTWDTMCLAQSVTEVTTKGQWAIHSLIIESIKTTSMEDVSTRVLEKNKEYLRR